MQRLAIRTLLSRVTIVLGMVSSGLSLGVLAAVVPTVMASPPVGAATGPNTTRFTPLTNPSRIMDTRSNLGNTPAGRPRANSSVTMAVTGKVGIPDNATAVVMNVTVAGADGPGYVTVYPGGGAAPTASNVNTEAAGQTIPNLVTVPVGVGGKVSVFTSMGADLIADVFGYYVPAASSKAGRYISQTPARMIDTRSSAKVPANGVRRVALSGVPADAVAAVLNVTVTATTDGGFWTAYAAGARNPGTSNLNVAAPNQTIANQVIVPVAGGAIDVFSSGGGHLIVDLFGYFTGASAADSTSGLFVPMAPTRFLDTRGPASVNPLGNGQKLYPSYVVETPIIGRSGIPSTASAVVMNTTLVDASRPGFVTVFPAGTARPDTSTVNSEHQGQTIANHTISPITGRGAGSYASGGAHLIQDVTGWFTGWPLAAPVPAMPNQLPAVSFPMTLTLPTLGVSATVGEGIGIDQVNNGPGHWPGTSLPGRSGNMAVFGHRVSHTHPFRDLDQLVAGDEIVVKSGGYEYYYRYVKTVITSPDDVSTIAAWSADPTLTLVACHPPTSVDFRIVVRAVLFDVR
jgi:LPXTG-site transpeptidase (sortase) family protein